MTAPIAVYVQAGYEKGAHGKKAHSKKSYDSKQFIGVELVREVLLRAGYAVDYCSAATAPEYRIILVSITCPLDWYSFIRERATWRPGACTVIVGGAGNLNIRPVLAWADIFVFGRAEGFIVELVRAVLEGAAYQHPAVAYAAGFNPDRTYQISQAAAVYPHPVRGVAEAGIGCRRKCLFCSYTWHRRYTGGKRDGEYNSSPAADERTIFDFDLADLSGVKSYVICGVDGMSERLRLAVNKPITNDRLHRFLVAMAGLESLYKIKWFNIVGYPSETPADWRELREVVKGADAAIGATGRNIRIDLVTTPFKAMPATPLATWPMAYFDFRADLIPAIREDHGQFSHKIWEGKTFSLLIPPMCTESLPTVALWALMLRGTEADAEIVRRLSLSTEFKKADIGRRRRTLERYLDLDRLFGAYTWETLPTRYLTTYVPNAGLAKLSNRDRWLA